MLTELKLSLQGDTCNLYCSPEERYSEVIKLVGKYSLTLRCSGFLLLVHYKVRPDFKKRSLFLPPLHLPPSPFTAHLSGSGTKAISTAAAAATYPPRPLPFHFIGDSCCETNS